MFEAYAIGVTLKLNNLISPQLVLLAKEFEKLEGLTVALNTELRKIGTDATGLRSLAAAGNASNRALEKASLSAAALGRHLAAIKMTSAGMVLPAALPAGRALPGGAGGGRHGGGPHGGNIHVGPGGVGLGAAGFAAGRAFWPLMVTGASIYAGHSLFESAKDLDTERQRFKLFGLSNRQNQEAFDFVDSMRVYGTSRAEKMKAFREAQGVFRESGLSDSSALAGAKIAAPVLARLDFLASSLDDESQAKMATANRSMLRYVESSGGLKSAAEFNRIADFGYRMNETSGGTVNWEQLRQFKARAGASGFHLTDDAMARLEPTIAEMKGGAVGFGLSTAFNRLTGAIRIPNQVAHHLVESGIWDKNKVIFNEHGGIRKFLGNPLGRDKSDLLLTNPELFYETYIRPMHQRMKLSAVDIARENIMLFGTTGGRNATLWENQLPTIHRSVDALGKAKHMIPAAKIAQDSLSGQMAEFNAAWHDFKIQFGEKMLPFFTGILKGGSAILRFFGDATPAPAGQHWVTATDRFRTNGHWASNVPVAPALVAHAIAAEPDKHAGQHWVMGANHLGHWESSPFVARGGQQTIIVHSHMDGRKVGEGVTPHLVRAARKPLGGMAFDPTLTLPPVGLNYAR